MFLLHLAQTSSQCKHQNSSATVPRLPGANTSVCYNASVSSVQSLSDV